MSEMWCPFCKKRTETTVNKTGDTVCSDCGVVLEANHRETWDVFGKSPSDLSLGGSSGDFLTSPLRHWHNQGSNPDHERIGTMCDRLSLVAEIKDRALEIYKKVEDLKASRVRNQEAVLAACLYIACRQEDRPRTVKEICSVAGTTVKDVGRAKKFIVKQLQAEMGLAMEMGTINAGIFLSRFCSLLGMSNAATKAAQETAQKSGELDIRRSPISIAAAVIYMITQLSDEKKTIRDIMLATGVAELTIRSSYKDIYPYASRLIPTSFATEEDLGRLSTP